MKNELKGIIKEDKYYSVRSSANIEDEFNLSFAGQFETKLNQKGIDSVLSSINEIWNSQNGIRTQTYIKEFSRNSEDLKIAIIIQEMVYAKVSGVVFTRNPINGLNEIIIESVKGLGEDLVQRGITPDRWVNKWGEWTEKPHISKVKQEIINQVLNESKKISKKFGEAIDLEWAHDGQNLYWLQLRPITTLKNNKLFSNKLSKEFMPGMIKPLIWSVNIPVVNSSWKNIFKELIGKAADKIDINNLAHPFYYRSYFNMKIMGDIFELLGMPRDLLENLAGIEGEGEERPNFRPSGRTLYYLPRILLFCLKLFNFSRYIEKFLKSYSKKYQEINQITIEDLSEKESLDVIYRLFELNTKASYFVILTQLLNSFYNNLIKSKLSKNNIDFERIDFSVINERLRNTDPRIYISKLHQEFKRLSDFSQDFNYKKFLLNYQNKPEFKHFKKFISKFGFLRDNGNDFSQIPWQETPELMFRMVIDYVPPENNINNKTEVNKLLNMVFKTYFSKILLKRAIKFLEYRQTVTNLYSYGYGLFRLFFLRISDIFVQKNLINEKDDIFYLNFEEIKEIIKKNELADKFQENIIKRKTEMDTYQHIDLPEIIYDDHFPKPINNNKVIDQLSGVPTSKGFYIGPVKVVSGIRDIDKIQQGDVLVIPYSDVSWTPLFNKAKAVISESGGILSHCSIVAREYKIPAVVSVNGATQLKDNTMVAVDAFKGNVKVLKEVNKIEELYETSRINN